MNRKDRRARRAQERRARRTGDTMGSSYGTGPLPRSVTEHPAFKAGQKATEFSPEYYQSIEDAARLISEWYHAQPERPTLRWVQQKNDRVFLAAALDVGAQYLADSPDAFRLLAWLDERTERKLSLNQATWALRRCRAIPMPDGSYYGTETTRVSPAMRTLQAFADGVTGDEHNARIPGSPCGHCGELLDHATGAGGGAKPGDLSMCIRCLGMNAFDEQLRHVALSAEEFSALPAKLRDQLEQMRDIMRATQAKMGQRKGPAVEA